LLRGILVAQVDEHRVEHVLEVEADAADFDVELARRLDRDVEVARGGLLPRRPLAGLAAGEADAPAVLVLALAVDQRRVPRLRLGRLRREGEGLRLGLAAL